MIRWPAASQIRAGVPCAGIKCLRNNDRADHQGEQGSHQQRGAGAGAGYPEFFAAAAKLLGCKDLGVDKPPAQLIANVRRIEPDGR